MTRKISTIVIFLLAIFLGAGGTWFYLSTPQEITVSQTSLTVHEFKDWISQNKEFMLIDVRTPEEYQEKHILEAINMPLNLLASYLKDIPQNKPVIVMCHSGNRSSQAQRYLQEQGFKNIINLEGGILAWNQISP